MKAMLKHWGSCRIITGVVCALCRMWEPISLYILENAYRPQVGCRGKQTQICPIMAHDTDRPTIVDYARAARSKEMIKISLCWHPEKLQTFWCAHTLWAIAGDRSGPIVEVSAFGYRI